MQIYMFPGQGSQARGMGADLFDRYAELTEKADKVLGYSIKELCLEDPRRELNKTQFTQPALFVVNALSYYKMVEDTGVKPDYLAGHSLGEINALLAAECFDFEAGVKIVKKRGELMSQATDGGMAAVLNASREDIERILAENGLTAIDLANYNTPSQIVISGSFEEIGKAQAFFQQGDMLYYPLNTSGAFHSRFMQPFKEKFETYLKKFKFQTPVIPVISNVTAKPYNDDEMVDNLANQLCSTVNWSDSMQSLLLEALARKEPVDFAEIGHGDVLTKIAFTIKEQTPQVAESGIADQVTINGSLVRPEKVKPEVKKADTKTPEPQTITAAATSPISHKSPVTAPTGIITNSETAEKVATWNNRYPIGTKVVSLTMDYGELETRTEAVVLFGHRAAVYMKSYNGYFDLDEIKAV